MALIVNQTIAIHQAVIAVLEAINPKWAITAGVNQEPNPLAGFEKKPLVVLSTEGLGPFVLYGKRQILGDPAFRPRPVAFSRKRRETYDGTKNRSSGKAKSEKNIPTIIEFLIDSDLNVMPMVPPGNPLEEMVLSDKK